jgi:hypothetical protein
VRSIVSLLIVLHLLSVAFVYSANVNPSRLQQRLAVVLAPYTQLLHLDPGGARLQFTDGTEQADDHALVIVPKRSDGTLDEAQAVRLTESTSGLGDQRRRLLVLGSDMASFAATENEQLLGLFSRSLAASVMRDQGFSHVIVRLEHLGRTPLYDDLDEQERPRQYHVFEAEVWFDDEGQLRMQKRPTPLQAAAAPRLGDAP